MSRFAGVTGALGILVPFWGPLFDFTGNNVQGVSLVPDMLKSMRLMTGTFGYLSRGVGRLLCLRFLVRGESMPMPLMRKTD